MRFFGGIWVVLPKVFAKLAKNSCRKTLTLTDFLRIIVYMGKITKKNTKLIILRIVLTLACALTYAWIFSNSLQSGARSSAQSHAVTDAVQDTAQVIAPSSGVATATGKDYDALHNVIRSIAHFAEFALLGALLVWCYLSYTRQKAFAVIPFGLIVLTPIVDECVQLFTGSRAAELKDIFLDTGGGFIGAALALLAFFVFRAIFKRRKRV